MKNILAIAEDIRAKVETSNNRMKELHKRLEETDITVVEEILIRKELLDIIEETKPMVKLLKMVKDLLIIDREILRKQ